MAESYTTNYQLIKHDAGDLGWDVSLNANLDDIDALLKALEAADADINNTITTHESESNPHGTGIAHLSDVYLGGGPSDGQVLIWNATNSRWEIGDITPPSSLSDLGDVSDSTPADGDVLVWSASQGLWVPSAGGGGGGATVLDGLADVDLSTPPQDQQALVFDATSGTWKAQDVQTQINSIGDINDVNIPSIGSLVGGEVLIWNYATQQWEPGVPASLSAPPVQIQIGAAAVPASSTLAVTFPLAFSGAPHIAIAGEGAAGVYIETGSITSSGFTLHNPNGADVTVHWIAIYGSTGGGGGTVITGEGLPIDVGGTILTIPSMPE
jgi:hypothetical protein